MAKELFRKSTMGSQHTVTNGAPNYERYEYLEKVFYKNEFYRIFSRPVILGRDDYGRPSEIRWMTDYNFVGEPVSLLSLSPGEQELVRGKVKYTIDLLYKDANRYMQADPVYKDLSHILDNCIEIPNDGCIYILKVPDEAGKLVEKYVLTQWGFINDDRKSVTGIVKRWTGLRTQNIRIRVSYPDGFPAIGENIYIEYGAVVKDLYTDEKGFLLLDDFPLNVSIHAYQLSDHVKVNVNNINTDERQEYSMTIHKQARKGDLTLILVDYLGKALPGIPVNISYPSFSQSVMAGPDGKILLQNIEENTGIDVSVAKGPQNSAAQRAIRFSPDHPVETLMLPAPEPVPEPKDPPKDPEAIPDPGKADPPKGGPMILQFINKKNGAVPNLPVEMVYNGKRYLLRTDGGGKISLKDVPFDRTIEIRAKTGNSSYKGSIVHTSAKETHTLQLRENSLWWLWILGLIALLLLVWFLERRPIAPTHPDTYKVIVLDSNKAPIQNADISLKGLKAQSSRTDSAGVSVFTGLTERDTFQVSISNREYTPLNFSGEGERDTTVILYKVPLDTLPHYPPVYGKITVRVIDSFTRSNLGNANVQIDYQSLSTTTDGYGLAVFSNIPTGTRTNSLVTLQDFEPARYSVICCVENIIPLRPILKYAGRDSVTSNDKGVTSTFVWYVGDHPTEFVVIYNMDSIPDKMEIFCGRDTMGTKIFWTPNIHSAPAPVSYADTVTVQNTCGGDYVTVRVTGNDLWDPKLQRFMTGWAYYLMRGKNVSPQNP